MHFLFFAKNIDIFELKFRPFFFLLQFYLLPLQLALLLVLFHAFSQWKRFRSLMDQAFSLGLGMLSLRWSMLKGKIRMWSMVLSVWCSNCFSSSRNILWFAGILQLRPREKRSMKLTRQIERSWKMSSKLRSL